MHPFTKMQALGNDFVLLDFRGSPLAHLSAAEVSALADRRRGIGFDQLLYLQDTHVPGADCTYRIFNANGLEVEQCGNGARCVAHYLYQQEPDRQTPIVLASLAGLITVQRELDGDVSALGNVGFYRAALAKPLFHLEAVPVNAEALGVTRCEPSILQITMDGLGYEGGIVNVGNPHFIIPVSHFDDDALAILGERLQVQEGSAHAATAIFPEGVNLSWMQLEDSHQLSLHVFERGVGLTEACGSAAAAAAVLAILRGWCVNPVKVYMPGGYLTVHWPDKTDMVSIAGPAVMVYQGTISLLEGKK